MKLIEKRISNEITFTTTHYIRDATGNIMATYTNRKVQEIHLYGSSRLGTYNIPYEPDPNDNTKQKQVDDFHKLILGRRNYELSNHLGNVLAVISDKKILNGTTFEPDVVSANDYYPFGMTIQSRTFANEEYRFGFQGQETEKELFDGNGSFFKYRISDNRIGRFFSIDPLSPQFPWNSSYAFSENRVIDGIELEGAEYIFYMDHKNKKAVYIGQGPNKEDNSIRLLNNTGYSMIKTSKGKATQSILSNYSRYTTSVPDLTIQELKVRALLLLIRAAEAHYVRYEAYNRYKIGGTFSNVSKHPGAASGTAAGAFQLMSDHFMGGSMKPVNQDKVAVGLLRKTRKIVVDYLSQMMDDNYIPKREGESALTLIKKIPLRTMSNAPVKSTDLQPILEILSDDSAWPSLPYGDQAAKINDQEVTAEQGLIKATTTYNNSLYNSLRPTPQNTSLDSPSLNNNLATPHGELDITD